MKKLMALFVIVSMLVSGCAYFCANGPEVVTKLNTTVDVLKALTTQLQLALLSGYDAEIELAYLAAKGSLAAAKTLLEQTCPDPAVVNDVVNAAEKVSIPQGNAAYVRAQKLKLVK